MSLSTAATPSKAKLADYLLLVFLAVLWGADYSLIRVAVQTIPPTTLTALCTVIACLFLYPILKAKGIGLPRDLKTWSRFLFQSLFSAVIPLIMIAWAEQTVTAGLATILNSTAPIFTFLINWGITRHEPATLRKLIGVVAGMGGVTLIVGFDALQGLGQETLAQLALVGAAAFYAWSAIFGRFFNQFPPLVPAMGTLLAGLVWLLPLALIVDRPWTLDPPMEAIVSTVVVGVFTTGLGLVIYYRLLANLGAVGVTSQGYLRVPIGVWVAGVFLDETMPSTAWIGLICVVVGVAAMTLPDKWSRSRRVLSPG